MQWQRIPCAFPYVPFTFPYVPFAFLYVPFAFPFTFHFARLARQTVTLPSGPE